MGFAAADGPLSTPRGKSRATFNTALNCLAQLLLVLLRWYPERRFVCTADGNYATHDLAELASQYCRRLTGTRLEMTTSRLAPMAPRRAKWRRLRQRRRLRQAAPNGSRPRQMALGHFGEAPSGCR